MALKFIEKTLLAQRLEYERNQDFIITIFCQTGNKVDRINGIIEFIYSTLSPLDCRFLRSRGP